MDESDSRDWMSLRSLLFKRTNKWYERREEEEGDEKEIGKDLENLLGFSWVLFLRGEEGGKGDGDGGAMEVMRENGPKGRKKG